ncbi:tetratricopeptide repeat protein [Nocardia araoensis]|uniref:tetratricopeptide repeat protein n=1 Tax=Nocardia araoensis TaxID=228600 RepID=UPI00030A35A6|nr:tetratricopeptide repeat protein [Nocardia araoensis]
MNNLGTQLFEVGRGADALAPTEEAVALYRRLAEASPAAFLSALAGSLNNLGTALSETGRRADALAEPSRVGDRLRFQTSAGRRGGC